MTTSPNFFRPACERACLVAWMLFMLVNTVLVGLSVELIIFGVILSVDEVTLFNSSSTAFLGFGFLAALNIPLVIKLHDWGVAHLNFSIHEDLLGGAPESWEKTILALLDESASKSNCVHEFIDAIAQAECAADRQERRSEAKAWLIENYASLSEIDQEVVNEHLGYLKYE